MEKYPTAGYKPTPSLPSSIIGQTDSCIIDLFNMNMGHLSSYTKSQLALRNGQDMEEVWCAYRGIIYDLSTSHLWRKGQHYEHWAGQDLTDELEDAPHDTKVFRRFTAIGKLIG